MRCISIFLLLIIIALPSLYLYSKNLDLNIFLFSVVPIIYLWALIKNSRYLIVLYPFIVIVPFTLFYIYYYDTSVNEQVLSVIFETNWQEALSFLGADFFLYLGLFIVWLIGVTALYWQNYRYPICWTHRSRWWVVLSGSSAVIISIVTSQSVASQIDDNAVELSKNFLIEEKNSSIQEFKQTYPLGLIVSLSDLYQEQAKINKAFARHQQFSFHASASDDVQNKQLVVLVIGETSRRANWQLNGYSRNTNPYLSIQSNLINFNNMLSVSNLTRSSTPMLLTRKPSELVNIYDFPEKSIISAFKEAGFHTYWLSTQQKFGRHDTSTSVYAKEADDIIFLNKTNYSNQGETDEVVLPVFKKILNTQNKKIFIVIHTLGSHYDYAHRYPAHFDKFRPSLNDLDNYSQQDKHHKEQLINSYDNSILYTDYVLNELIENMKTQTDTESFLLYSSDHGEDLFDGDCNKSGHNQKTIYNFEIASFAWYSNSFAKNHPIKIQKLKENMIKKINQTSVFPTLIDAASINIPNYQRERSLLGDFKSYPRLILGGVDYDQSSPQGACREIK